MHSKGGGTIQKVGAQITWKLKKVGAQTFYFQYLRLKKWVRSCALCALGSAAPALDLSKLRLLNPILPGIWKDVVTWGGHYGPP